MRAILMPSQKLPQHSQCLPSRSDEQIRIDRVEIVVQPRTHHEPWSTHSNPGAAGSSVVLVASPMTEWFEPKVETE